MSDCRPTVAEIDLGACVRNLAALRSATPGLDVWAVVKADAYGHGARRVARCLESAGANGFCVATATEGVELRRAGVSRPVLVLGPLSEGGATDPFALAAEYGLAVSLSDVETAERLAAAARSAGIGPASVQLKVDTGMARLGAKPDEIAGLARHVDANKALSLDGLLTNLATADAVEPADPGLQHLEAQVERFRQVCATLDDTGLLPPNRTVANSSAAEHHAMTRDNDLVTGTRPGLALYGATLTPEGGLLQLQPVMRLVTRIASIRDLPAGVPVGYGLTATTRRPTRVAALPLGYHDGLPRVLGERGKVWLRGRRVPIIGRISMDITLVDVTDVSAARSGDEVVLFGRTGPDDRDPVLVEQVAEWAGTIPHEILCRVGSRVPRRYSGGTSPSEIAS